ncbi:MAG: GAF domain-containing protein [Chloroflexi bacterium]|nr:GAF domain-containing protein [Chloroflexota bacterium]
MNFLSNINARRILVAESDPDEMDRTTVILEEAGYNVHKAYYAGDAMFALQHSQFDLALVDSWMKDRDQRMLTDQMVRFSRVRWIALVDDQHNEPHRLLRQGASAFVFRPLTPTTLLRHIDNVLQGKVMSVIPDSLQIAPKPPSFHESPEVKPEASDNNEEISQVLKRRLIEQQTLSKLARSLSAVLDLDALLTQVVDAAVQLSNAEEGLLLLPDDEAKALFIRAVKGIDSETARNFRIKTKDTLAGQVFRSGQPILIGDQGLQKVKTEYLVKSLLYVPLSIKGQTIGVLGVNNKNADRTFGQHDLELLQDLAAHAAVAIENARLYEETVMRNRELSTLVEAGEAANSTLAIDQVLSIIAGQLISALNVAECYIAERDPESRQLRMLAVRYRALWRLATGPVLSLTTHPAVEQAFRKKRMLVVPPPQANNEPAASSAWLPHYYQAKHIAYVPLMSQDQPLGVVILYRIYEPYSERTSPQAAQLELQQMALEMSATLVSADVKQHQSMLFRTAQRMLDTVDANWCEIALWNPGYRQFHTALSYGETIWRDAPELSLDLDQFPQLARIVDEQNIFSGPPTDDLHYYLAEIGHARSLIGLPMVIKGQVAGLVLLVDTLQDRHFYRREVELAQALIMQAANALGNARLYRDLEMSLEELHRTQAKLVQTARLLAMGELAAAVAHQINNPLTTILGDTELILQDLSSDDLNREAIEAISRAGKRALEVVRRLLTMARQQPEDNVLQALDVNETIYNTLTLVRGHIQQGSIALHVELQKEMPPVVVNQGQLEDVWMNLLMNARDAVVHRVDPQIAINSRYDQEHRQIEVMIGDNGIGIPMELQSQVFEPFFTTKPPGEGTGLGLHICQQIVHKCHGQIRLESAYNQGTRFIVSLPVETKQGTE